MSPLQMRGDKHRLRLMRRMAQRLNVDILEFMYARLGGAFAEGCLTCVNCENAEACAKWLQAEPAEGERPSFCPNLPLFGRFVPE